MTSPSNPSNSPASTITALKSEIETALRSLLQLSDEAKIHKNEDAKEMIRYYGGMTDSMETRRIRIADFAWQSLAVTLTAAGVILSLSMVAVIKIPLLLVLATIFVVSLLKIREYQVQSALRYPFRDFPEYANMWKWFYYGNPYVAKINHDPFTVEDSQDEDQSRYLQGLKMFVSNYSGETIDQELHDNLLQLFILQVHNYYKNRFYLRLVDYDIKTPKILAWTQVVYWILVIVILAKFPVAAAFLVNKAF